MCEGEGAAGVDERSDLGDLDADLEAEAGAPGHVDQSRGGDRAAVLRHADVEGVAGPGLDGGAGVVEGAHRLVEQDAKTGAGPQPGEFRPGPLGQGFFDEVGSGVAQRGQLPVGLVRGPAHVGVDHDFQRKEDVVTTWAEQRQDNLRAFMDKSLSHKDDDATVQLERCMAALADFNEAEPDLTRVMLTAWVRSGQPLLEEPDYAGHVFTRVITMGQTRGDIARDIDPVVAGNMLRDAYLGLLYRWTQAADGRAPLHVGLRALLRIALTGVLSWTRTSNAPLRDR